MQHKDLTILIQITADMYIYGYTRMYVLFGHMYVCIFSIEDLSVEC